ncbi:copper resistance CopC/CopD family protein [Cohnella caldifontis]|uniref:copper resistance CopC/CopD family protein n=1 Tax=Cohnella caldifontis TaxID=3027471 RepID=UPI0023EBC7C1|nr:copper resistance protein CopC [Cohnella sp. YIM B05605]
MSKNGVTRALSWPSWRSAAKSLIAILAAAFLMLGAQLPPADAHAELVQTTPSAGERLSSGPAAVELAFNERLDPGGAKLTVLNDASRTVAGGTPERFNEGKSLRLKLPQLEEGNYTVSYSVISEDGHPVSGAFVFTVGNPPNPPDNARLDPHAQVGHHHGGAASSSDRNFLMYAGRIAYYAGLLLSVGLVFWSLFRNHAPAVREAGERAISVAGKSLLLAVLVYVAFSLMDLAQGEPLSEWLRILKETTIGRLYVAELLLGLAAPLLPSLGRVARAFWAVVFLAIESWSGHAVSFSPKAYAIALDFVHLAAAALWAGGLLLLFLVWLKERPEAGRFALRFSQWALAAFLALWVTGVLSVLLFLPSPAYLTYTPWGTWLLVKAGLTVLVVAAAILIRLRLRRGELPRGAMIKADFGLMAAIVFVVGILTYQTPLPPNKPIYYHQMGTDMHMTLRVTPNVPGINDIVLKVWLPEKDGEPKQVRLLLIPQGREDVGSIAVPLQPYQDEEIDDFPDFAKYTYEAKGPYLPFAGKWTARILVTDANGNELERETSFRNY